MSIDDVFSGVERNRRSISLPFYSDEQPYGRRDERLRLSLKARDLNFAAYALYHAKCPDVYKKRLTPDVFRGETIESDDDIHEEFSTATVGIRYDIPGWQVIGPASGSSELYVERGGVRVVIQDVHTEGGLFAFASSGGGAVRFPCFQPGVRPGYFVLHSPYGPGDRVAYRIYLNLLDRTSISALIKLWSELARRHLRFTMKFTNCVKRLGRTDSAVIYLPKGELLRALSVVKRGVRQGLVRLGRDTSIFALRLGSGISLAEEPPDVSSRVLSFGQHRACLLADMILAPQETDTASVGGWKVAWHQHLLINGVDPRRLYRNLR